MFPVTGFGTPPRDPKSSLPGESFPGRREEERTRPKFILVPGAGGLATPYWRLVSTQLTGAGHRPVPVDLPGGASDAGLPEYTAIIVDTIRNCAEAKLSWPNRWAASPGDGLRSGSGPRAHLGQRNGACARRDAWRVVDGNGGDRRSDRRREARGYDTEFDMSTYFLHDLGARTLPPSSPTRVTKQILRSANNAMSQRGPTFPPLRL